MDITPMILWSFPILFIFHDFEEIIFIKPWMLKNQTILCKKFPRLSKATLPHLNSLSTSSFSLGVAEEFLLINVIAILSYFLGLHYLWLGAYIAFTIHLVAHCIQCLVYKGYVPCIVTSIICLPICLCTFLSIMKFNSVNYLYVVVCGFIGIIITVLNVLLVHRGMDQGTAGRPTQPGIDA